VNNPNLIPCASCGLENNVLSRQQEIEFTCFNCGADLHIALEKYGIKYNHSESIKNKTTSNSSGEPKIQTNNINMKLPPQIGFLKIFAWLYLIISFLGSFIIWSNQILYGFWYGVGVLLHGFMIFALFSTIAIIATNVINIKNKV